MSLHTEDGIVIGNVDNKYATQNPISRMLMRGFLNTFDELVQKTGVKDVHEIGCGEGHLAARLAARSYRVRACDFSKSIVAAAASAHGDAGIAFSVKSIYELDAGQDSAPLIICCEVLEHLERPLEALEKLRSVTAPWCVLSVPREPIWRALNLARGKYIRDLGNTPGHLQHWSKRNFVRTIGDYFDIAEVRSPLPWTMVLCRARRS